MIMFLLGAPGAGKGTLSAALKEKYHVVHISTGDCFRAIMKQDSPLANKVKDLVSKGILIPDEITNQVLKTELDKHDIKKDIIVLDGYPRNVFQLEYLNSIAHADYAIDVDVPKDILIKRLTGRRSCPVCKTIYNIYFKKPKVEGKCDKDGADLIQRSDDNLEVVNTRFEQYEKLNAPLVKACKDQNIYHKIDNTDLNKALDQLKNICNL